MFERASKKLGLDKAVFSTGAFSKVDGDSFKFTKQSDKDELELLLRKGAYAILDNDDENARAYMEEDIDKILNERTNT